MLCKCMAGMGDATGSVVPQATFNLVLNCALIACNGLNQVIKSSLPIQ